jgi:hypothetical protein
LVYHRGVYHGHCHSHRKTNFFKKRISLFNVKLIQARTPSETPAVHLSPTTLEKALIWLCPCLWERYERGINKWLFWNARNLHIKSLNGARLAFDIRRTALWRDTSLGGGAGDLLRNGPYTDNNSKKASQIAKKRIALTVLRN